MKSLILNFLFSTVLLIPSICLPIDKLLSKTEISFEKNLFLRDLEVGAITDLYVVRDDQKKARTLMLAGKRGIIKADSNSTILHKQTLLPNAPWNNYSRSIFIKSLSLNDRGILRVSGSSSSYDSYLNSEGELVWYDKFSAKKTLSYDLNENGTIEIIQLTGKVLSLFTIDKELLWKREINLVNDMHVMRVKRNNTIIPMIILSKNGRIIGVNKEGETVFSNSLEGVNFFSNFSSVKCVSSSFDDCLLVYIGDGYRLYSINGEAQLHLYKAPYMVNVSMDYLKIKGDVQPLIVITGNLLNQGGQWFGLKSIDTHIYVFTVDGKIVYSDVLKGADGGGFTLLSSEFTKSSPAIAVGGYGEVWLYGVKPVAK